MAVSDEDKHRFVDAWNYYKKCIAETKLVMRNNRDLEKRIATEGMSQDAGAQHAPELDKEWSYERAEALANAMNSAADWYLSYSRALNIQAEALRRVNRIAEEIMTKIRSQLG